MNKNYQAASNEENAARAIKHTELMNKLFRKEILTAMVETQIFRGLPDAVTGRVNDTMRIGVLPMDSVSAVMQFGKFGKSAVLNFASFTSPGGRFLLGSSAQEEALCHESCLYNVLAEYKEFFYEKNEKLKFGGLYDNAALYSPDIVFMRYDDDGNMVTQLCDVITCAAPNNKMGLRYRAFSEDEDRIALTSRIIFILRIAKQMNVQTLILGAFGCGVFGQDPRQVANLFGALLRTNEFKCFDRVIFAIPSGNDSTNYSEFYNVFKK